MGSTFLCRFDHMNLESLFAIFFLLFPRASQLRVRELEKSLADSRAQEQRAREIGVSLKCNYRSAKLPHGLVSERLVA